MKCPRCNRTNNRSIAVLSLKFLAITISAAAIGWVIQFAMNFEDPTAATRRDILPANSNQADVRF